MANVLFRRGDTATINGTAITDGQLLYDTTNGRHYIDVGSTRKEVGTPTDTVFSSSSTNAIANSTVNAIVPLIFSDKIIINTTFVTYTASLTNEADLITAGYIYRAPIACVGVTTNHSSNVVFGVVNASERNYAPVTNTIADTVYIYAKSVPLSNITILTVKAIRGV